MPVTEQFEQLCRMVSGIQHIENKASIFIGAAHSLTNQSDKKAAISHLANAAVTAVNLTFDRNSWDATELQNNLCKIASETNKDLFELMDKKFNAPLAFYPRPPAA